MKRIPLTKEKFAIVDDEDFHYLSRFSWQYAQDEGGLESVRRSFNTKFGIRHINIEDFILSRPLGIKKSFIFKNGDRLDFRKENLEFRFIGGVKQGAKKQGETSSIYKGVTKNNGRGRPWRMQIEKGKRGSSEHIRYIASFDTEKAAGIAYNKKAKELFGEFAYQNEIV